MANTVPASENTLEDSLNRTDFGHWLFENRKAFIAAVVVVFVSASSWLIYKQMMTKNAQEFSAIVYKFEVDSIEPLKAGKLSIEDFAAQFKALQAEAKSSPSMIPLALEVANFVEGKDKPAVAQDILKDVVDAVGASSPFYIFVAHNYAALAEKNGQTDVAIKVMDDYIKSGHKIMLVKAYLDLGRLHLLKGNKAEAKTQFDYIVGNYPNDELAKLARLYLQQTK
jgi:predicted negative regulator of RcsB-dependent stress response